ncbi:MAG: lipoate--protein ligase [Draconibacterium sp.]|nr:lipoate--protein ligase [Draconibacterium sp.]
MLCINLKNRNPYFCLAAEEYLLKNYDDDIFMLWQSDDTVVVGKHQNALGEINYPFIRENKISVARRISGGGTVFHDTGNVNFSFIKKVKSPAEISFKQFTEPVREALAKLGVKATTSGRNDLLIEGKKISGNAEHIFKKRVLHHGTLLYNSDLKNLGEAIKVVPGKYKSKAVQSNRSEVANISSFLKSKLDISEFIQFLIDIQLKKEDNIFYELNEKDNKEIETLVNEKFKNWEWNFGYSPKYSFKNEVEIEGKNLIIQLNVKKGIIVECKILGDYFSEDLANKISNQLKNKWHFFNTVQKIISEINIKKSNIITYYFF